MTTAVECEKFRKRIFEVCGNDISLKYGLTMIQKILAKIDQDGSSMERFFCYSKMHHEERDKMEQEQLLRIVKEAGEGNLENIANLAKMGRTTKDKLLLIVKALWEVKGINIKIPETLKKISEKWIQELNDPEVERLVRLSFERVR